jgi:hypothetical protein
MYVGRAKQMAGESSSFFLLLALFHVIACEDTFIMTRERHTNNGALHARRGEVARHIISRDETVACTAREAAVRGTRMLSSIWRHAWLGCHL